MNRVLGSLALIAAVALAGCGKAASPTVATASRPAATQSGAAPGSASASAKGTDYDKALRYTRCMTEHGTVTPDPVVGSPLVTANLMHRNEPLANYEAKRAAHEQCKQFLPTTWPIKSDPADYARARPYFDCLRQHGQMEPEPDANGMLQEPTDELWRSTPEYEAAVSACRHLYDDPANNQPENK